MPHFKHSSSKQFLKVNTEHTIIIITADIQELHAKFGAGVI